MHVATIIGLLVVICGLANGEMKNPLVQLTKRCDSSLPVLHGKHWAHDWDARMDFKCPGSKYIPIISYSNSCVHVAGEKKYEQKKETD